MVAQHLDVAGEWFGRAGLVCATGKDTVLLGDALEAICEVLDNYLFAIKAAREKHTVMMRLGRALRHRVLGEGVKEAVKVLAEAIPMDSHGARLRRRGERHEDPARADVQRARARGRHALGAGSDPGAAARDGPRLPERHERRPARSPRREERSRGGADQRHHEERRGRQGRRHLEDALVQHLRPRAAQRVCGLHPASASSTSTRSGAPSALAFRPDDVGRLLQNDDYEKRFLAPREETVGVVYIDISGFTKVSETILKTPAKVAQLVEEWSRDAVDIVWQHGGVFDKMVGDCVIALFGPPFYEEAPGERLARAIQCAIDVRAMTHKVPERVAFEVPS